MATVDAVRNILGEVLQLGARAQTLQWDTALLGNIPEFDSMAVIQLITALEEYFGFTVDDDEINADVFATLGSLTEFVDQKSG